MNQILNTIENRRTTRKFLGTPVESSHIDAIIEAGLFAPSAHNQQSWHFTVIEKPELLAELNHEAKKIAALSSDSMLQNMGKNEQFNIFYGAPVAIIVSGANDSYMPQVDCAAATQNMLIAAESLGLGSCWNGIVTFLFNSDKKDEYVEKLGIPEGFSPYYAAVFGHKAVSASNAPARRVATVTYIK